MKRFQRSMALAATLLLAATPPLDAQLGPTRQQARVAVVNETGRPLQYVTVLHKYADVFKSEHTWRNVRPGTTGSEMAVSYNTGIGTTGRDWWMVIWMYEGDSRVHHTSPNNFRAVLDLAEQAGHILVPVGAAAFAGAVGAVPTAGVGGAAAAAAGAVLGTMIAQAMLNNESTAGFKQHILRSEDSGRATAIHIRSNGSVVFRSRSGNSETVSTSRAVRAELLPDAERYVREIEQQADGARQEERRREADRLRREEEERRRADGRGAQGPGPAGSPEGTPFSDACDIAEIRVNAGWWIDGVQVVCRGGGAMPLRGGGGGSAAAFVLQPGERLRGISGSTHGAHGAYVYSLQFHTDRRSSPVYGNGNETDRGTRPFRFEVPAGAGAAGLTGSAGQYLHLIGLLAGEPQTTPDPTRPVAGDLSGTYRIHVKATGHFWHEDGNGDKRISTRWQPDDDFTRFTLERQADGSYRIRVKASNRYLHVPGHEDWIASTIAQVADDYTRFFFEPQPDGSFRIRQKATGRYLHEDGGTTKMVNTRWQPEDDFTRFILRRAP
jgi:hypothetical protein